MGTNIKATRLGFVAIRILKTMLKTILAHAASECAWYVRVRGGLWPRRRRGKGLSFPRATPIILQLRRFLLLCHRTPLYHHVQRCGPRNLLFNPHLTLVTSGFSNKRSKLFGVERLLVDAYKICARVCVSACVCVLSKAQGFDR